MAWQSNAAQTAVGAAAAFALGAAVAGVALAAWKVKDKVAGRGKKVAVVLSGCGYLDGSEVNEAVFVLTALSEFGAKTTAFAPDKTQADVLDHQLGKPLGFAPRQILQESARITRGDVQDLAKLDVRQFDALVIPGGFGVAKNLCNWARDGPACAVDPHVERVIKGFVDAGKPVGCSCIAPVLLARLISPVTITVGKAGPPSEFPYGGTVSQVKSLPGVQHVDADATGIVVDSARRVVTTPAYMQNASRFDIYTGIRSMVLATLEMSK